MLNAKSFFFYFYFSFLFSILFLFILLVVTSISYLLWRGNLLWNNVKISELKEKVIIICQFFVNPQQILPYGIKTEFSVVLRFFFNLFFIYFISFQLKKFFFFFVYFLFLGGRRRSGFVLLLSFECKCKCKCYCVECRV